MPHGKQESKEEEVVAPNCVCSELNSVPKSISCLPRVSFSVVSNSDNFIFVTAVNSAHGPGVSQPDLTVQGDKMTRFHATVQPPALLQQSELVRFQELLLKIRP